MVGFNKKGVTGVYGSAALEIDDQGRCVVSYHASCKDEPGCICLTLVLGTSLKEAWEGIGNPNSLPNKAIWNSMCLPESRKAWDHPILDCSIRSMLALSNLHEVLSIASTDSTEEELRGLCKTIGFLGEKLISIEVA